MQVFKKYKTMFQKYLSQRNLKLFLRVNSTPKVNIRKLSFREGDDENHMLQNILQFLDKKCR